MNFLLNISFWMVLNCFFFIERKVLNEFSRFGVFLRLCRNGDVIISRQV